MDSLYFGMDVQQYTNVEHSCNYQSCCPLFARLVTEIEGYWHGHCLQFGLQGGKNGGLYRFLVNFSLFLAKMRSLNKYTHFNIETHVH